MASVLITGASGGLGRALAVAYAKRAAARGEKLRLWLTGRDAGRLAETENAARSCGAEVDTVRLDITDRSGVEAWILACNASAPLDVVIANAGRSAGTGSGPETAEQVRILIETNVSGVVNTVIPAASCMRQRRGGKIVIVSSLAARVPFPSTPAYSAAKAFVRTWGFALRPELAEHGVGLTVVSPGYVNTPMTAINPYKMQFMVSADWAAYHILRRLEHNPPEIGFSRFAVVGVTALALLPRGLFGRLMLRQPRKPALTLD
jgi:short-subunit dehydrogenase